MWRGIIINQIVPAKFDMLVSPRETPVSGEALAAICPRQPAIYARTRTRRGVARVADGPLRVAAASHATGRGQVVLTRTRIAARTRGPRQAAALGGGGVAGGSGRVHIGREAVARIASGGVGGSGTRITRWAGVAGPPGHRRLARALSARLVADERPVYGTG